MLSQTGLNQAADTPYSFFGSNSTQVDLCSPVMNKVVLLFSGQGAQQVGMGKDLYAASESAKKLADQAASILGKDLLEVMFEGPADQLTRTSFCQPALYLHGLMCREMLLERIPDLDVVATAGLSLGEFTAHASAGSFDFETGLRLVARRGQLMEQACLETEGAMAAMIGGDEDAVRQLAADCDIDIANYNAPGQIVVSGASEGVKKAVTEAKNRGIRMAKLLNVAGAYHSRLMKTAQDQFTDDLNQATIDAPGIPVVCNFAGYPVTAPDEVRSMAAKQVSGSVRWTQSMRHLLGEGHELFIELGPGKVLAGLMARIQKGTRVLSIDDIPSLEQAAAELS